MNHKVETIGTQMSNKKEELKIGMGHKLAMRAKWARGNTTIMRE